MARKDILGVLEEETWTGTDENDILQAEQAHGKTINALGGDDTIRIAYKRQNWGSYLDIDGGEGNDTITVGYVNGTNDNILQYGGTVKGGAGDDVIKVIASNASIYGGDGNDTLINDHGASNVLLDGGIGDDVIDMDNENATVYGGAGNDSITVAGKRVTVNGGTGNDTIKLRWASDDFKSNAVLTGGDGADTFILMQPMLGAKLTDLTSSDKLVFSINPEVAGAPKNPKTKQANPLYKTDGRLSSLTASYSGMTLSLTGKANQQQIMSLKLTNIKSVKNIINTVVYNGSVNGALNPKNKTTLGKLLAAGKPLASGAKVSSGKIVLSNSFKGAFNLANYKLGDYYFQSGRNITASASKQKLTITGDDRANLITGGTGNDTLRGGAGNDTLQGGAGNDYLQGGAGNDNLQGGAGNDKLLGEAGNDALRGYAGNDTLTGGAGNDVFTYANGEGKDTITDYTAGQDTLYITSNAISKTALSGKNVVFTVGKGSVTLSNAKGKTISLKDNRGSYSLASSAITLAAGFGGTMDASKYFSTVKTVDASKTAKAVNLTGNAAANTLKGNAAKNSLSGNAGNDYLYGYAANDTLSGGAGNDYLDGGAGADILTGGAGSDIFVYRDGADTVNDYEAGKDTLYLAKGAFKSTTASGKNLVFNVGSGKVTLKNAAGKTVTLKNANGGTYTMTKTALTAKSGFGGTMNAAAHLSTITTVNGAAATKASVLYGNAKANTVTGGSANDKLYGYAGNDKLIGGKGNDYLDGGAGNDSLTGGAGNDTFAFAASAGNDTIADYTAGQDTLEIVGGTNGTIKTTALANKNKDMVFKVGSGSVTLTNAAARTISLKDSRGSYTMNKTALTLSSDFTGTMDATKYLSTITTVDGRSATKTANLYGNSNANTLRAGKAGGTLRGGAGNDTLHGGAGADTFYYDSGNDTIYNYAEGKDTIRLGSSTLLSRETNGNDIKLNLSSGGTITLKGAVGMNITYIDNNGKNQTLQPDQTIIGTAANDLLAGGTGNDLLDGCEGDDELTGGAGNDTFRYHYDQGNDIINDYEPGKDKLLIEGGTSGPALLTPIVSTEQTGDDVSFRFSACTVTVKNGKGKTLTLEDNRGGYTMSPTALTLGENFRSTMNAKNYLDTVTTVDGRKAKQEVVLYGNDQDNVIYGGTGNDFLYGDEGGDTITGGAGADSLAGGAGADSLDGGNGNDWLYGGTGNDTLTGGEGKDTFTYWNGTGDDIITDYAEGQDVFYATANKYYISPMNLLAVDDKAFYEVSGPLGDWVAMDESFCKRANALGLAVRTEDSRPADQRGSLITKTELANGGKDIVFTVGSGTVTLQNAANKTISLKTFVTVSDGLTTTSGNASFTMNKTVLKAGADFFGTLNAKNYLGTIQTVDGSAATKKANFYGNANANTIKAGQGGGEIGGGAGNDTLYGGAGADVFKYVKGQDTIFNYDADKDKIRLADGVTLVSTAVSGNDRILNLSGDGRITIKGAAKKTITYIDKDGAAQTIQYDPSQEVTQLSVIQNFMAYLDETNGVSADELVNGAVNYASNGLFTSWDDLVNSFADDLAAHGGTKLEELYYLDHELVIESAVESFLTDYCGINLRNTDTGAITGADAGGATEKTKTSIVPENGTIADVQSPQGASTTINGLTFLWPEEELNETQRAIVNRIYTWWAQGALDLIEESYGLSFTEEGATVNKITVQFGSENNNNLAWVTHSTVVGGSNSGTCAGLTLTVNMNYFNDIHLDDVNGDAGGTAGYLDRVLAHELTHAVMAANINYFSNLPSAVQEGLAELVHGIDDTRTQTINTYAQTANAEALRNNLKLNIASESSYAGGYMLFRYFAKQVAESAFITITSGSSGMIANSAPIVGTPSAQLASLVSTTQTGNLGTLPGTGLASPEASGSSLITTGGGTSNPLANKKTA